MRALLARTRPGAGQGYAARCRSIPARPGARPARPPVGKVGGRRKEPPWASCPSSPAWPPATSSGPSAGTRRYEQIRRTSGKVWNSDPVQKQVAQAKEAARTKAAPVVADLVADAARATGEKLRQGRTIASEAIHHESHEGAPDAATNGSSASGGSGQHADAWAAATKPPGSGD